ncbi:hypothetical protein AB205_0073890 [Aquarana catesbeiana]|uniref:Ig-like domain-containing protein n=1 Tax=Aquarana catesbeiana TaxID=8400 RepID=A0A2G9RBB1_AQUCT|nr:hypothetical protein AB205_0073890 [Aquarana catesbeiana]
MTCNLRSPIPTDMSYTWYKDNNLINTGQSFVIINARTGDSGNYQCKGTKTEISDPVRLDVIYGYVILQAPIYVHEGDNVTLKCHHYPGYSGGQTIFYKDNTVTRDWGSDPELHIYNINLAESKVYKCTKKVLNYETSSEASIPIKELFTTPEIKVTPFPVLEGDNVTVTCHTNVSPYRPETELQFAFHKAEQNVQRFGSSDQYGFQSAKLENSGEYYCEVSGRMRVKRSKELNIEINEPFTQSEIIMTPNQMTEGDNMTLTCHTIRSELIPDTGLEFAFYRDGQNVQGFSLFNQYEVHSAETKHSGSYSCKVTFSTNKLTRSSKELYIQIQELFSTPEIEMIPVLVSEGNQMILKCNTIVIRNNTELQFAFYKNIQKIQEFNSSHQYVVRSAHLEDSGNYYCEVRTLTSNVKKKSEELNVDLQGVFQGGIQNMIRLILSGLLLITCFLFIFYHIKFIKSLEPASKGPRSPRL